MQNHAEIRLGISEAIDRRDRRDDDRVPALEQCLGRRQTHLLDMVIDRGVFLDIRVGRRDVGFGLVVIVVGDEILNGVVRKELAHFAVELGGQCLVMGQHERRPLQSIDDVGHGERLA